MISCPRCKTPVQPDWDWCYACGWDPDGLRPDAVGPTAPAPRPGPGAPPFGAPAYGGPPGSGYGSPARPAPGRSSGSTVLRVALACGGALIGIVVVSLLAVTLLGTETEPAALRITTTMTTSKPAPTEWLTWTATSGAFSIDFPSEPLAGPVDSMSADFVRTEEAKASYGQTQYFAGYYELGPEFYFPDPYPIMNSVLDAMGEGTDGITFSSRTRGTFGLLPSLSFTGSVDGGKGTVQGIEIISEQTYITMYTVAYAGQLVDYDHFVGSFALV